MKAFLSSNILNFVPNNFKMKQKFIQPKILLIEIVNYDSLMINVPFIGVLTYCGSEELPVEAAAATPTI